MPTVPILTYIVLSVDIHMVHPFKNEVASASDTHTCTYFAGIFWQGESMLL